MNLLAQDLGSIQSQAGINAPSDLGGLITNILPYIFYGSGALLLIYMVLGGLQWMTSQGDQKAIAAAQAKITNAVIGIVVILLSAGLVVILGKIFKIDFTTLF